MKIIANRLSAIELRAHPKFQRHCSRVWFEKDAGFLISMPGVPFEMEAMMEDFILPRLSMKDNTGW